MKVFTTVWLSAAVILISAGAGGEGPVTYLGKGLYRCGANPWESEKLYDIDTAGCFAPRILIHISAPCAVKPIIGGEFNGRMVIIQGPWNYYINEGDYPNDIALGTLVEGIGVQGELYYMIGVAVIDDNLKTHWIIDTEKDYLATLHR